MKERPILFSGPMVRAILSGAKTQTRRVVKPAPDADQVLSMRTGSTGFRFAFDIADFCRTTDGRRLRWEIPYGQPGDRLWVREAFMPCPLENPTTGPSRWNIAYASDAEQVERQAPAGYNPMLYNYERWTPSIHMPRWASRITLEITGVRVERLQAISEADARAEGAIGAVDNSIGNNWCARQAFSALWESINGPGSWDANPWVWVVSFRMIDQ